VPNTFTYVARDLSGAVQRGTLEAESREAAVRILRSRNYFVTSVNEVQAAPTAIDSDILVRFRPVRVRDLAVLFRQFSIMITAGVSVLSCLDILHGQCDHPKIRAALRTVRSDVERGETLSKALSKHPNVFPSMVEHMVEAGEVGGALEQVLDRLAVQYEGDHELRQKVVSALAYPAVVTAVALIMGVAMITFILPMFASLFEGFGTELPAPTRLLMTIGELAQRYWYVVFGSPVVLVLAFSRVRSVPEVKALLDRFSFKVPLFKDLNQKVAVTRLCRTLGTMIRNGVPMIQALEVSGKIADNAVIAEAVRKAQDEINRGQPISGPLRESGVFPTMVTQMIAVGEETGSLEQVLDKIAAFYETEVENTVKTLTSLIEPLVMVVLAAGIGFVVVAVLLPVLDMAGQMGF